MLFRRSSEHVQQQLNSVESMDLQESGFSETDMCPLQTNLDMSELSLNDIALNKREGNVRVWKMYDEAADFKIRLSDFEKALASLETATSGEERKYLPSCVLLCIPASVLLRLQCQLFVV